MYSLYKYNCFNFKEANVNFERFISTLLNPTKNPLNLILILFIILHQFLVFNYQVLLLIIIKQIAITFIIIVVIINEHYSV